MKKKGIWITLVIVLIIVLWAFGAYNGMVNKQEAATTALADVQSTYQRRADLLPNLTRVVKAYAKHENSTFTEVAEARSKASQISLDASSLTPEKLKQFDAAQGELSAALGKLMMVSERYPDLKASENFKDLQIQLEGTENRINEARQKYNEAVQDYNISIRRMPNVLLSGMFGFDKMAKFEAASGADKAPVLNI
ncbi:MAG: LemA family protein [Prevotella sp.]|jgi:LemA protein|nr:MULTISPECIES: LemA family protein [unclassified Prevotella]MCH3968965.1 LemA family protein [Prevotella sp.]MCH3986040.1 LemA family protein [Prevotella sp.]MCH3992193.1 LemA family protein [Prevotella sp.]MCH4017226.1 LemA family protein [Prevotella sp.]MCH4099855.1 LemA family protein [Prevotella sp.]